MDYIEAILVATADGSKLIQKVLPMVREEWPDVLVSVIPDENDEFSAPDMLDRRLRAFNGEIAITPNRDICDRWDAEGYKDYGGGVGPVILSYAPCVLDVLSTLAPDTISARTGDITYNLRSEAEPLATRPIDLLTEGLTILNVITPDETDDLRSMVHRFIHQGLLDLAGTAPGSTLTRLDSDSPGKNNLPIGY